MVEDQEQLQCTSLDVSHTVTIDRLVTAALEKEKVNVAPSLVTVEFEGVEIRGGWSTSD